MARLFPINMQQEHPIFGRFNDCYGDILVGYCQLLNKFQINILTVEEYNLFPGDIPQIEDIDSQPFASFIKKDDFDAETTIAGIVFCPPIIERIGLNEKEQFASIAHEIGHILYFFMNNKADYPGQQGEEIYCDSIASKIGLTAELLSTIIKLENSGLFPDPASRFGMRKLVLCADTKYNSLL